MTEVGKLDARSEHLDLSFRHLSRLIIRTFKHRRTTRTVRALISGHSRFLYGGCQHWGTHWGIFIHLSYIWEKKTVKGCKFLCFMKSLEASRERPSESMGQIQALCVTTHKCSWVKLFMCLISIGTRSSSHLVREMHQNPGLKYCFLFWKTLRRRAICRNFQDLILALDACYWLHKVIFKSLSRFGDDRRCNFSLF